MRVLSWLTGLTLVTASEWVSGPPCGHGVTLVLTNFEVLVV